MKSVYTVGELRGLLEGVPDEASVLCQVVDQEGSAWNLFLEAGVGERFKWDVLPFLISLSHPALKVLPDFMED